MKPEARRIAQADMAARFMMVRRATEGLARGLSAEDCALQSMPDASPVKWHLAHTTWFFETFVLARFAQGYAPFAPEFRYLFNSYYNGVGEQFPRAQRGMLSRPGLERVLNYRSRVDSVVQDLLQGGQVPHETLKLLELGLHHEQQHQELILTDLQHLLSLNPLAPAYRAETEYGLPPEEKVAWIEFEEGETWIGHDGVGFAFDNELPRHRRIVGPFALASRPATNREYCAFIEDGGYRRPELWLSDGWAAVRAQGWRAPLYWQQGSSGWMAFGLNGLQDLDLTKPVMHVNQFEADAFARWSNARLPTEFEWEHAAVRGLPRQGRVWEWTSSDYAPYPGYRPVPGVVGEYNGKFMSNQYVLRGGSRATPGGHVRPTYRNFFPSSARWQFSGVRLARDPG